MVKFAVYFTTTQKKINKKERKTYVPSLNRSSSNSSSGLTRPLTMKPMEHGTSPVCPLSTSAYPWPTLGFTFTLDFNGFLAFLCSFTTFLMYPERACPWTYSTRECLCLPLRCLGFSLRQGASLFSQAFLVSSSLWSGTCLEINKTVSRVLHPTPLGASWRGKGPRFVPSPDTAITCKRHPGNNRHSAILCI